MSALPLCARSPRESEVDCALCVKGVLMCAVRVGVCRDMNSLTYKDNDGAVYKREDEVKEQYGYAMARSGGFGGVASPPSRFIIAIILSCLLFVKINTSLNCELPCHVLNMHSWVSLSPCPFNPLLLSF